MSTVSAATSHDQIPVRRHVRWLYKEDYCKQFKQLDKIGPNNCANKACKEDALRMEAGINKEATKTKTILPLFYRQDIVIGGYFCYCTSKSKDYRVDNDGG